MRYRNNMKRIYSTFLLLGLLVNLGLAQTGTITIAKPPQPKKDTIAPPAPISLRVIYLEGNYTFKGNNRPGIDAGFMLFPKRIAHNMLGVGLEWDYEQQYYLLSPFNNETMAPDIPYNHSQTKSSYLKLQGVFRYPITINRNGNLWFHTGIAGKYLLKTENEHHRLNYSDFHQYNMNWFFSMDVLFGKGHYAFGVKYSKDFFQNLKDRNIYNELGNAVGKINSKNQLLSVSLKYVIRH